MTREQCEAAVKTYVEEASDSIKSAFDKAFRQRKKTQYANAPLIVEALSALSEGGAARADILRRIQRKEAKYPEANLKYLLPRLCTAEYGGVIRFDSNSGLYSFSDPIYRAYSLARFHWKDPGKTPELGGQTEFFERMLLRLLTERMDVKPGEQVQFKFSVPSTKRRDEAAE